MSKNCSLFGTDLSADKYLSTFLRQMAATVYLCILRKLKSVALLFYSMHGKYNDQQNQKDTGAGHDGKVACNAVDCYMAI